MKRLFVFFLVGPLVLGSALAVLLGSPSGLGGMVGLPVAGLIVAFPTAAIDHALDRSRWQLVVVSASGSVLLILVAYSIPAAELLLTGLAGGISSGFCSWMVNQNWSTEQRVR